MRLSSCAVVGGLVMHDPRKLDRSVNSIPTPSLPPRCMVSPE